MGLVDVLKSFGLSDYEAKALVALLSKGTLTAKEVSELSGIPRTSVYDVMDSLLSKGLVESFGKPRKFKALSARDVIFALSRRVNENIEYLKRELPKIEAEEVDIIRVYRGEMVLEKIREFVEDARKEIVGVLSYIPDSVAEILRKAKCKLILISSNASIIETAESYEFRKKEEVAKSFKNFCHGLFIFDNEKTMSIFLDGTQIAIVSESSAVIEFSKMVIIPVINFMKSE
ncbi:MULTISPECIES: TrmB family transcriptional regulator [unclassified Archaeoglobus]|jgi:sugar-specific transcriptional regulator TrmB|uniref:TrmB family transcriptional regulator n=1 Tax=unclassified Archaeoglobus TaxID=2643606 RepID=UPI0025C0D755|nr:MULTISPECIES: TrmB family transcriptional regulator [unclassified Archaeoglobus]